MIEFIKHITYKTYMIQILLKKKCSSINLVFISSLEWLKLLTDILQILLTTEIYYQKMNCDSSSSEMENTCLRDAGKAERSKSSININKNVVWWHYKKTHIKRYFVEKTVSFRKRLMPLTKVVTKRGKIN